ASLSASAETSPSPVCAPQITPKKRVLGDVHGVKIPAQGFASAKQIFQRL
ncbi:hypothetical protein A2U01_0074283, partial [Trifolium medium]|nr:hypothetical protein [Trifolium medium]